MKINFIKKRITHNLFLGGFMLLAGIVMWIKADRILISSLWIVIGTLQFGFALYERKHQYITIENGLITKHSIFKKEIEIDKIEKVRRFKSSYKIETADKTVTINKNLIEAESMYRLDDFFKSLNINTPINSGILK